MDSEKLSQAYWQQVPHSELPHYGTAEKTAGDLRSLKLFLQPNDRILDLGCGWGRISVALAKEEYHVTGVDLSDNLIGYARQHATKSGSEL